MCILFAAYPANTYASGGQSITGSRAHMSEEASDILAEQINLIFLDARKAKERCDRERYNRLISLLEEKARLATASMQAHAELMQQMSLNLNQISQEFRRFLPSGVGGSEIADLALGEAINIGLAAAEAAPIVGQAINAVKTLKGLAEKEGQIREVADIANRLEAQYREILRVLLSHHRWKERADQATGRLASLARKEFNCPREGDGSYDPPSASDWQEVAKGDLVDDETGEALEGATITIDPVDDEDMTSPEDREIKPGDRIIITAPCHEKIVYVAGIDEVPDRISLRRKPIKLVMDCALGEEEIIRRAMEYLKEQGVEAEEDDLEINEIGEFDGKEKCEVSVTGYGLSDEDDGCPRLSPTDMAGGPDDSAGPGDDTEGPGDDTEGPGGGIEAGQPREGQEISDPLYGSRGSWGQSYDDQWGLKAIGFVPDKDGKDLWPNEAFPVTVAVIDTGLDMYHPELIGATWINEDEVPANGKDDDGNGFIDDVHGWNFVDGNADIRDNNGHGTFVAGVIAAWSDNGIGMAGVNPWARIMPVKATDFNNKGDSINIAKAIRYAVDNGARVINISIGGSGYSALEEAAVKDAIKRGAVIVAASGNKGVSTREFFPAGLPGVVTVSSTGVDGKRVGFSNWGPHVDIAAPGIDVLSLRAHKTDFLMHEKEDYKKGLAIVGEDGKYYRTTGSSFSAPFVSGVASLILSINPDLTGEQARRMVLYSVDDIDVPGRDQYTGYGMLNARAALEADPEFYLEAVIKGVKAARVKKQVMIRVVGTADANRLKGAWIEIGPGKSPKAWTKVSESLKKPVRDGVLGQIPGSSLKGSKQWTVRLVAEHKNGRKTEARYILNLN